jgi:hypothetical protein
MKPSRRTILSILASVIVPLLLQITLVVVNEERHPWGPGGLGFWAPVLSLTAGFLFLVREFRVYAIVIALFYFPTIYWLIVYASLWIGIIVYGAVL